MSTDDAPHHRCDASSAGSIATCTYNLPLVPALVVLRRLLASYLCACDVHVMYDCRLVGNRLCGCRLVGHRLCCCICGHHLCCTAQACGLSNHGLRRTFHNCHFCHTSQACRLHSRKLCSCNICQPGQACGHVTTAGDCEHRAEGHKNTRCVEGIEDVSCMCGQSRAKHLQHEATKKGLHRQRRSLCIGILCMGALSSMGPVLAGLYQGTQQHPYQDCLY